MKKKAVVILNAMKGVYDFIWYYATYGKEYDWIAVCRFYGKSAEALKYCQKMGIFKEVIWSEERFDNCSITRKISEFIKMGFFYISGKQEIYCQHVINRNLKGHDYDLAVILNDFEILNGAIVANAKKKDVVIFEDGLGDYLQKDFCYLISHCFKIYEWIGFFIAKMGYANPMQGYSLKYSKYCDKYATYPDRIPKERYRSVNQLRDMRETDMVLYEELIERTFGFNDKNMDLSGDLILFTSRLEDLSANYEEIVEHIVHYINKRYSGKKLLLKKHPADTAEYNFDGSIIVNEISSKIPGEVFLELIDTKDVFFIYPSTLMEYPSKNMDGYKVFYFEKLCREDDTKRWSYKEIFAEAIKNIKIAPENIIEID